MDNDRPIPQPWRGGVIKAQDLIASTQLTQEGRTLPERLSRSTSGRIQCSNDVKYSWVHFGLVVRMIAVRPNGDATLRSAQ